MGFAFGLVCLLGLFLVIGSARRRRWHGYWGHHYGGERYWANALFDRLGTSSAQEKVILAAVSDLQGQGRVLREGLRDLRRDAAQAMRGEQFDAQQLSQALSKHDADLTQLRQSVVAFLATTHETLDPVQRQRVARWLEDGLRGGGHCGWHSRRHCGAPCAA
ncbi:MAG TPA: periplasmic heavy metal sensor [Polyangiaceae bacterium]|nr:periplasmic heavy metal sensor [Polyangiaceae bacterium]